MDRDREVGATLEMAPDVTTATHTGLSGRREQEDEAGNADLSVERGPQRLGIRREVDRTSGGSDRSATKGDGGSQECAQSPHVVTSPGMQAEHDAERARGGQAFQIPAAASTAAPAYTTGSEPSASFPTATSRAASVPRASGA